MDEPTMIPEAEQMPQPALEEPNTVAPSQQVAVETAQQQKASDYPPALGGSSGAAWVIRDLASI